ncbi:MAG: PKD domain-containing protein [Agriterribacter sp.]
MKHLNHWLHYALKSAMIFCLLLYFAESRAQTQGLTDSVHKKTGVAHGYYYSLPLDYASNPTKKYPLLIALHGNGEKGNGTTELYKVLNGKGPTIPQLLKTNKFPAYVKVDDQVFSFIVVCPQYSTAFGGKPLIQHLQTQYSIDTNRIYFTGLSEGSAKAWHNLRDTLYYVGANAIAAMVLPSPTIDTTKYLQSTSPNLVAAHAANLPLWLTRNGYEGELSITKWTASNLKAVNSNFNGHIPVPQPLAKTQVFEGVADTLHNSWVKVYNSANIIDSANGYNIYQWMLQYTNEKLVAKAGKDTTITLPADSVTLNGRKSTVRQGRINTVTWSKISGPSAYTIASLGSLATSVTGLVAGTYQFELKLNHTDGSTVKRDTVTVTVNPDPTVPQTQGIDTVIYRNDAAGIKHSYYVSLPRDYAANPTKKYPLLIALHANEEKGDGSDSSLAKVLAVPGTIPYMLNSNSFPASFMVNNENFSFIVVCPQYDLFWSKYLLQNIEENFRVDQERIYVTGQGEGGVKSWTMASSSYWGHTGPDSLSAIVLVTPTIVYDSEVAAGSSPINKVNASNLPVMSVYNTGYPSANLKKRVDSLVFNLNSTVPSVDPPAKKIVYDTTGQDAWTKTYNPANIIDSVNGYNMYQWLLQYRNKNLVANAGRDTAITASIVTLNGSKSTARRGRIAAYLWTKISGGSVTIASNTSAVTNVSGLSAGIYKFELKVTHNNSTIAKDTITITVTGSSSRVASPVAAVVEPATTTDEMLTAKINPTVARSQVTIVINGKATGKANLQVSSMDGKRLQRQSFVKDAGSITRTMNVSNLPSGTYIVEVIVAGKHRKVLRFIKP